MLLVNATLLPTVGPSNVDSRLHGGFQGRAGRYCQGWSENGSSCSVRRRSQVYGYCRWELWGWKLWYAKHRGQHEEPANASLGMCGRAVRLLFAGEVFNWCSCFPPVLASILVDVAGTCDSVQGYLQAEWTHEGRIERQGFSHGFRAVVASDDASVQVGPTRHSGGLTW